MPVVDISSNGTRFVSPFVTQYTPGAYINIDSELTETVTVTGVNETFKYTLTGADLTNFMSGFKVSGVTVDTRMGQVDVNYDSEWDVTMGAENATNFKSVLDKIIGDAVSDASHNLVAAVGSATGAVGDKKISSYLHAQLYNAFVGAFGGMLGPGPAPIAGNNNTAANAPSTGAADGQEAQTSNTALDAMDGVIAASSSLSTKINSFDVLVDMDASAAAAAMITDHTADALRSLFRQIPRTTLEMYLDASGGALVAGEAQDLSTNSLPVLKGDKLVFVFDIDVHAAGPNTSGELGTAAGGDAITANTSASSENVPTAGTQSNTYGTASVSLNLANRRVAVEITLGSGGGPF